ncbi:MAG: hypothetical protein EOP93_16440, partial [Lysobacteraceae bacterium]
PAPVRRHPWRHRWQVRRAGRAAPRRAAPLPPPVAGPGAWRRARAGRRAAASPFPASTHAVRASSPAS